MCVKLGGLGAVLICIPVIWAIHQGSRFNPVSYFLWTFLSIVCTVVAIRAKKGGWMMMAGYTVSDFAVGLYAYIKSGRAEFGRFEVFIVTLAAICACLYVWCELKKNFTPAVITNATACLLVGIPQMIDAFKSPDQVNLKIAYLYVAISGVTFYGETPTLNGRLIPGLSTIYWLVIIVATAIVRS